MTRTAKAAAESKKDVEIERLKKENDELREKASFLSTCSAHDFVGFEIGRGFTQQWNNGEKLTNDDLGRLVSAFNEKFHYGLFVQYHMANEERGQYLLFAISRYTHFGARDVERRKQLPREDETAMRNFVRGFIAAVESKGNEERKR